MITRELIEQWRIAATAVTEPNDPDYRHEIVNLHVFAELAAAHGQAREYLASPEQSEPVAWAISYNGKTPYKLWDYSDGALLDAEIAHVGGTASKMPLYAAPQPVQNGGVE